MTLYEKVIAQYPELEQSLEFKLGKIVIQDDSDGQGAYIAKWEYSKPLPEGMKVGKN